MSETDYETLLLAWEHNAFYEALKPMRGAKTVLTSLEFDKKSKTDNLNWMPVKDFLVIYRKYLLGNL